MLSSRGSKILVLIYSKYIVRRSRVYIYLLNISKGREVSFSSILVSLIVILQK
jgi:hypothetical protein